MTAGSERKQAVAAAFTGVLAGHGIARVRGTEHSWPIAPGFRGWLDLDLRVGPAAAISAEPSVGVWSEKIETLVRELGGDLLTRPALVSVHDGLWNLHPGKAPWLGGLWVAADEPVVTLVDEVVSAFEQYGRPCALRLASLAAILAAHEAPGSHAGAPFVMARRIAARLALGDAVGAEIDLAAALNEAHARPPNPYDHYPEVAERWAERLPAIEARLGLR